MGAEHALVVHGTDGLDEITTTGPTHIGEVRDGRVRVYMLDPAGAPPPTSPRPARPGPRPGGADLWPARSRRRSSFPGTCGGSAS